MRSSSLPKFQLRPHDALGSWQSNDGRYRADARELLKELEGRCAEVIALWPQDSGTIIDNRFEHPELWTLARLRDRCSDSVRIYSAMAVEGFLNFYGVLRLGNSIYDEHFERLGLVPKLRMLLLHCDQTDIPRNHAIVHSLDRVAQSRNQLVHPKSKEVALDGTTDRGSTKVPDVARASVADMEMFFEEFALVVPAAESLISRASAAYLFIQGEQKSFRFCSP